MNNELQSLHDQIAQQKSVIEHAWKGVKDLCVNNYDLKLQLAAKESEIARYIAANSILCDSESEVKLANENNRLEIENAKLREALKELVPIIEKIVADDRRLPFTTKVTIDHAKELLTHNQ